MNLKYKQLVPLFFVGGNFIFIASIFMGLKENKFNEKLQKTFKSNNLFDILL